MPLYLPLKSPEKVKTEIDNITINIRRTYVDASIVFFKKLIQ